jgi:hypothetical protein
MSQPLILRGERSGLQTHIATTEDASLCVRMKNLTVFLELEAAIRSPDEKDNFSSRSRQRQSDLKQ